MGETIGMVIGLCLAVYGAAELIGRLWYRLLFGGKREPLCIAVSDSADAEYRIRRFSAWCRYRPMSSYQPLVLLYDESPVLRRLCTELGLRAVSQKEWDTMCKSALQAEESTV